jgi:GNAT superfamily N-acetyltransferase
VQAIELRITDTPPAGFEGFVAARLDDYNERITGVTHSRPLSVVATEGGEVVGGIAGHTSLGLLFIDLIFVPESHRGQGVGVRAMAAAEREAAERGCTHAVLYTIAFQAPGFYERLGYEAFGRAGSADPRHARIVFRKVLAGSKAELSTTRSPART